MKKSRVMLRLQYCYNYCYQFQLLHLFLIQVLKQLRHWQEIYSFSTNFTFTLIILGFLKRNNIYFTKKQQINKTTTNNIFLAVTSRWPPSESRSDRKKIVNYMVNRTNIGIDFSIFTKKATDSKAL